MTASTVPPVRTEISDRWERVIRYFEERGGRVQIGARPLGDELGLSRTQIQGIIGKAERYGLIEVRRHVGKEFGGGQTPNLYVLQMGWEDWQREHGRIIDEYQESLRQKPVVVEPEPAVDPLVAITHGLEDALALLPGVEVDDLLPELEPDTDELAGLVAEGLALGADALEGW